MDTRGHRGNIVGSRGRVWLTAKCPICGRSFDFLEDYRPTTCGAFTCVQEAVRQKLIPPSVPYSGISYR